MEIDGGKFYLRTQRREQERAGGRGELKGEVMGWNEMKGNGME